MARPMSFARILGAMAPQAVRKRRRKRPQKKATARRSREETPRTNPEKNQRGLAAQICSVALPAAVQPLMPSGNTLTST
jgi:hypothetical protein